MNYQMQLRVPIYSLGAVAKVEKCCRPLSTLRIALVHRGILSGTEAINANRNIDGQMYLPRAEGFHQDRLKLTSNHKRQQPLGVQIRCVWIICPLSYIYALGKSDIAVKKCRYIERDDEIDAASWLRAKSFYAYPEDRKFAGEVSWCLLLCLKELQWRWKP